MWLFDTDPFPPRWGCGQWSALEGWTHIGADTVISICYMLIPLILLFARSRTELRRFRRETTLFALFIAFCGFGHALEAPIFWHPVYRFAGLIMVTVEDVGELTELRMLVDELRAGGANG